MVLGWEIDWKLLKTLQKCQGVGFACHNLVFGLRSVRPRHTLKKGGRGGGGRGEEEEEEEERA